MAKKRTSTTKSGSTFDAPQSRNEAILQNILGANNVLGEPQSRIEALLMQILEQGGGGAVDSVNGQTGTVVLDAEDVGAIAAPATNITYSALKSLRDGGELVPGMTYRITDYVTKVNGTYDLSAMGAEGYLHYAKSAEHPFDILVTADNERTLNENAYAIRHEGDTYFANSNLAAWKLKYIIDNDATLYTWADSVNGKGVIWQMTDEFNNTAGYDFKNVQYLRYALKLADTTPDYTPNDSGLAYDADSQPNRYGSLMKIVDALMTYMRTGNYVNPFLHQYYGSAKAVADYDFAAGATILGAVQMPTVDATYLAAFNADWYYTFDFWNGTGHADASLNGSSGYPVRDNTLALEYDAISVLVSQMMGGAGDFSKYGLGINVWEINDFGEMNNNIRGAFENRVSFFCWSNTFGMGCFGNDLPFSCYANTFGSHCSINTFGNNCYSNTFGDNCLSNTFGNACDSNTFGDNCYYGTFGDNCDSNTFGDNCYSNMFGDHCYSNTFGNECYSNTFGNTCSTNTFGDNCYSNMFGDHCYSNTFGNGCYSNTFGASGSTNTFGDNCSSNMFGDNCDSNTFGNHVCVQYCDVASGVCSMSITNASNTFVKNLSIKDGFNTVGNTTGTTVELYDTAMADKNYQIEIVRDANGKLIMSWQADMLTRAGKYKANASDAWHDIV